MTRLRAEELDAGLVWPTPRATGLYGYPGGGPAGAASLLIRSDTGAVAAAGAIRC
jgi:hypothetical protein